ncbi:hypothetical protein PsYK624_140060 [Phanerochaete sordida]|uniref:Uncharacterized protein n=1 Tax=Phanerochaete sordida TaxID=48140 RepID=A0A9P3GQQ0_9APHY|nr:hypothetical protein PsYK624_140060 [Phanerochaete sordida]
MASAKQPQLRAIKKALRPHSTRTQAFAPGTLIAPSTAQSECSTLVDFGDEYLDGEPADDGESLLGTDNSAWSRSFSSRSSSSTASSTSSANGKLNKLPETAEMLDSDDMSWNLPHGAKRSLPKRILHALAGQ